MTTVNEIAQILKDEFRQIVADSSGMDFSDTGVSVPKDSIWLRYAEAVKKKLPTPVTDAQKWKDLFVREHDRAIAAERRELELAMLLKTGE